MSTYADVKEQLSEIQMNRRGFGLRADIKKEISDIYHSTIIDDIKQNGYQKKFGRFVIHLAKEFGFCYGVDRAVELAYETCRHFSNDPNKKIFLTTEIIHNPTVNQNLLAAGVRFLAGQHQNANWSEITANDVVIVPAFGATVNELLRLHDLGCTLVDTICGSVVNVWKRVEKYAEDGFTSIIHGKYNHEESCATSSRVLQFKNGHYLIVLDRNEANEVCQYIRHGGDKVAFLKKFEKAISPGFDPDLHLSSIGFANQTTMLSAESLEIAALFRRAFIDKFGEDYVKNHYRSFDTICSATQERQDAILELGKRNLDLFLVVGGYNSSNTAHLQEIAQSHAPSFHIKHADSILDQKRISHKPLHQKDEILAENWLPDGEVHIGITAGASTPNSVMGDVIQRVITFQ